MKRSEGITNNIFTGRLKEKRLRYLPGQRWAHRVKSDLIEIPKGLKIEDRMDREGWVKIAKVLRGL